MGSCIVYDNTDGNKLRILGIELDPVIKFGVWESAILQRIFPQIYPNCTSLFCSMSRLVQPTDMKKFRSRLNQVLRYSFQYRLVFNIANSIHGILLVSIHDIYRLPKINAGRQSQFSFLSRRDELRFDFCESWGMVEIFYILHLISYRLDSLIRLASQCHLS